jgi:hypothetical protein
MKTPPSGGQRSFLVPLAGARRRPFGEQCQARPRLDKLGGLAWTAACSVRAGLPKLLRLHPFRRLRNLRQRAGDGLFNWVLSIGLGNKPFLARRGFRGRPRRQAGRASRAVPGAWRCSGPARPPNRAARIFGPDRVYPPPQRSQTVRETVPSARRDRHQTDGDMNNREGWTGGRWNKHLVTSPVEV